MNSSRSAKLIAFVVAAAMIGLVVWWQVSPSPSGEATGEVSPLTGLPTEALRPHRALVVKVDSHPSISVFPGLQHADIVYEVLVEGGITRYLAIFHTTDAATVGPVRSLRSSDFDLTANLGRPAVLYSGANDPTETAAEAFGLLRFTPSSPSVASSFARDDSLSAPHNLFVSLPTVRDAFDNPGVVEAPFDFGPFDDETGNNDAEISGLRVQFGSTDIVFGHDPDRNEWLRWEDLVAAVDENDRQLGTANVLVLDTEYAAAPWDPSIPEALSVGSGDGLMLSSGTSLNIRWSREANTQKFSFTSSDGERVNVPPGRTWVVFAPPSSTAAVNSAELKQLVGA